MSKIVVLQDFEDARAQLATKASGWVSRGDGPVDLAKHVREIAESAVSSLDILGRTYLQFGLAEDCFVPASTASSVGVVVNELVMNAMKYAHPSGVAGHLLIGCTRLVDAILVDVVDDGVGLPEGFDPAVDGKFGLQLARSAAAHLNAKLDFVDTGTGLQARLHIPT